MSAKQMTLLLLPSSLFVAIACLLLIYSDQLMPSANEERMVQEGINELGSNIVSAPPQVAADRLLGLLKDARRTKLYLHETLGKTHAQTLRAAGLGIFVGVVLQFYVAIRLNQKLRRIRVDADSNYDTA